MTTENMTRRKISHELFPKLLFVGVLLLLSLIVIRVALKSKESDDTKNGIYFLRQMAGQAWPAQFMSSEFSVIERKRSYTPIL